MLMDTISFKRLRTNRVAIRAVFFLFVILSMVSILNHEMWRDEMDVWLVAKYNSLEGIFDTIKVQGNPALWFLVVKAIQQIFPSPFGMAVANLFFVALAVLLLLKYAPFERLQTVLLTFSYFIFYEYGTISRSYGMTLFCIFAVSTLYPRRRKYTIPIAALLAITCSIHAMNLVFAGCFAFLLVVEYIYSQKSTSVRYARKSHLLISALVLMIGMFLALYQAMPSEDSPWLLSSTDRWRFHGPLSVLSLLWKSFIPLSSPGVHFWNTNILPDGPVMILLSLFILLISCLFFVRKPIICSFYLLGITSFLFFFYKVYHGFIRHHGFLFILFVISYWLSFNHSEVNSNSRFDVPHRILHNKKVGLFSLICFIQFVAVFLPVYFDWRYPFSASKQVAQYLLQSDLQNAVLLGDKDVAVAPVSGWLDREIYYPTIGDYGRAVIWNHPNRKAVPLENIRTDKTYHRMIKKRALELANERHNDVIMILNYPIDERLLHEFPLAIVDDETYFIYRVNSKKFCAPSNHSHSLPNVNGS
jgi:hypothetical protein